MLTVALPLRLSGWVQHIKTVRVGSTYQNIKRYFDTMYAAVYSVYYTPWHGKIWSPYLCIVCLITFLDLWMQNNVGSFYSTLLLGFSESQTGSQSSLLDV